MSSLLSLNCRGFHQNSIDIKHLFDKYQPVCFCLQETMLKINQISSIGGYSFLRIYYTSGDRASGGVAIITSNSSPSTSLSLTTDLQAVAVRVTVKHPITVYSVYLPPNKNIVQADLKKLCDQLPPPFIIMGDFNGHNPLWGSPDTNYRGKKNREVNRR